MAHHLKTPWLAIFDFQMYGSYVKQTRKWNWKDWSWKVRAKVGKFKFNT